MVSRVEVRSLTKVVGRPMDTLGAIQIQPRGGLIGSDGT